MSGFALRPVQDRTRFGHEAIVGRVSFFCERSIRGVRIPSTFEASGRVVAVSDPSSQRIWKRETSSMAPSVYAAGLSVHRKNDERK
jgi:hypothetical protein